MNTLLIAPEPATRPAARAETSLMPNTVPTRRIATAEPRARILYVDDEPLLRRLGELALVRTGYDVDTAVDGTHGWEALQHAHYNLLITDDTMPGLTGLELSRNARLAGMRLPILMTSDSIRAMQNPAWAQLDIAAFLPKPFAPDSLVHTVEQVLISANNDRAGDAVMESALWRLVRDIQPYRHGGINE
jgi:DNA-binding response OmpR family regulator